MSTPRQRRMEVLFWTVNDVAVMVEMIERGVDGIIADDPALTVGMGEEMATLRGRATPAAVPAGAGGPGGC